MALRGVKTPPMLWGCDDQLTAPGQVDTWKAGDWDRKTTDEGRGEWGEFWHLCHPLLSML